MAVKKPSLGMIYEMALAALVIFSLVIDLPARQDQALSFFVWAVFVLDYFVRFFRSPKKWTYIREHPLEFIAMLPLGTTFQAARLIRLIRVIRLLTLMNRRSSFLDTFFEKYHIDKLFLIVVLFMFVSALSMKWIEPSFHTYEDALWWTVVTTTTVGYGDISPHTTLGKIIASILMMVGIGMIGVVTGTVTSLFTREETSEVPPELAYEIGRAHV